MGRDHLTRALAFLLLVLASPVHAAHLPGGGGITQVTQSGVAVCGGEASLELNPADFACQCTGAGVSCSAISTMSHMGSCFGDGDNCGTVDLSTASVVNIPPLASLTTTQLFVNPTASGQVAIQPSGGMAGTYYLAELIPSGTNVATGASIGAFRLNGALTLLGAPSAFGWFYFMNQQSTVQNQSGTALSFASGMMPYNFAPSINANNANMAMLNTVGASYLPSVGMMSFSPTFTKTGTAALTLDDVYPQIWRPTYNTGATSMSAGFLHAYDLQGSATAPIATHTLCTASGVPYTCCTGSGAGATCPDGNTALIDVEDFTNSKWPFAPIIFRQKGVDDQNRLAGLTSMGSDATPPARLRVQEPTINNEVVRWESGAAGAPLPSQRVYFARATAAASATTNIDFNLTTARPTDAACPSGTLCIVDSLVICHCTSGSACTGDGGAVMESKWAYKNTAGTVTQLGTTASGFILGQSVASLTSTQISSGSTFVTSLTQTLTTNIIREAVVVPANSNLTCTVQHTVNPVGT